MSRSIRLFFLPLCACVCAGVQVFQYSASRGIFDVASLLAMHSAGC